jgi:hypothetical protein
MNSAAVPSVYCEQHGEWFVADLEVFKVVNEHFRQDVREFWNKSNFYLLIQAGLLSVFVTSVGKTPPEVKPILVTLDIFGLGLALAWAVVARGSLHWLRRWRQQMIEIDNVVDRHRAFSKVENFATERPSMSPSNVTQFLPVAFVAGWLILLYFLVTSR